MPSSRIRAYSSVTTCAPTAVSSTPSKPSFSSAAASFNLFSEPNDDTYEGASAATFFYGFIFQQLFYNSNIVNKRFRLLRTITYASAA